MSKLMFSKKEQERRNKASLKKMLRRALAQASRRDVKIEAWTTDLTKDVATWITDAEWPVDIHDTGKRTLEIRFTFREPADHVTRCAKCRNAVAYRRKSSGNSLRCGCCGHKWRES